MSTVWLVETHNGYDHELWAVCATRAVTDEYVEVTTWTNEDASVSPLTP